MKRYLLTTCALLVTMLLTSAASATTVLKLDFDQLTQLSDAIVVGTVKSVEGKLHEGRVYTHIEISVDETLKGDVGKSLEIMHLGGRTKELATMVHGMPDFQVGERALLFLEKPPSVDSYVVTGLSQGKIELDRNAEGKWYAPRKTLDGSVVKPLKVEGEVKLERLKPGAVQLEQTTLADLRQRIAAILADSETNAEDAAR